VNRHELRASARNGTPPIYKITGKPLSAETTEQKRKRLGLTEAAGIFADAAVASNRDGFYFTARSSVLRALSLCPDNAFLLNILGMVVWNIGDYELAETSLRRSIELNPADYQAHANLGTVLNSMARYGEGKDAFRSALALQAGDLHTRWERSMGLLASGDWRAGFEEYECRIPFRGEEVYPRMPFPVWTGENLDGKTLFIKAEQGTGDRILFSRYVAWVHEKWPTARIKFLCSPAFTKGPPLEPLFWIFSEFVEFVPSDIPWPKADYGISLLSLPRIHGTRPDNVPPDPGLIRARVVDQVGRVDLPAPITEAIKVGMAWTGSFEMGRNAERSVPLRLLLELAENPEAMLYSLQVGDSARQFDGLGAVSMIVDLEPEIAPRGFVGTASVMMNLDLVITCCTSIAHLAGALGVPCWVLLNHDPYWVWLRGRDDSPWYPSVRLFRQPKPNDWRSVVDEVKLALAGHARAVLGNR